MIFELHMWLQPWTWEAGSCLLHIVWWWLLIVPSYFQKETILGPATGLGYIVVRILHICAESVQICIQKFFFRHKLTFILLVWPWPKETGSCKQHTLLIWWQIMAIDIWHSIMRHKVMWLKHTCALTISMYEPYANLPWTC